MKKFYAIYQNIQELRKELSEVFDRSRKYNFTKNFFSTIQRKQIYCFAKTENTS